jgi:NAD(P)H dehydrogenase (quinone)
MSNKKVYLILAQPSKASLSHASFESIKKGLETAGHEVKTLDLYEENFNPVLVFNENKRKRDLQYDPETQIYREAITWADHLIFVFPIWWSGMPAILKGFIDRVFAKGFAYEYDKNSNMIGLLKGKTAWIVTHYDAPDIVRFIPFIIHDYGVVLKNQVLKSCGFTKVKYYSISSLIGSTSEKRNKWLRKLYELGSKF